MPPAESLVVSPSLQVAATNTAGMIDTALAEYEAALSALEGALAAAKHYGFAASRDMLLDNIGLARGSLGQFDEGLRCVRTAAATHDAEQQPGLHAWACCHEATLLRRSGMIESALEAAERAVTQAGALDDAYARLNFEANRSFIRGLLGADATVDLDSVTRRATEARVAFVTLKAQLYVAILAQRGGRPRDCSQRLSACVPRQLELGHLHVLAQELCPRPEVALQALSIAAEHGVVGTLMDALAAHWRFADLAGVLIADHPAYTHVAVRAAGARASDEVLARILAGVDGATSGALATAVEGVLASRPDALATAAAPIAGLTRREAEILRLMADGRRNPEIAASLFIAGTTLKTHINHIFAKLGVTSRVEAVLIYRDAEGRR